MTTAKPLNLQDLSAEEERNLLHQRVGEALSKWGALETNLAMLFAVKLQASRMDPNSLVVFCAIENFRSKTQALDALFAAPNLDKKLKADWERISKQLTDRSKKRNQIAHHNCLMRDEAKPGKRALLTPALISPLEFEKLDSGRKQAMGVKDVEAAIAEFESTRLAISHLCRNLEAARAAAAERR